MPALTGGDMVVPSGAGFGLDLDLDLDLDRDARQGFTVTD
jgi:hypothetical protein